MYRSDNNQVSDKCIAQNCIVHRYMCACISICRKKKKENIRMLILDSSRDHRGLFEYFPNFLQKIPKFSTVDMCYFYNQKKNWAKYDF